ncbi:MAG TPA: ice-binding family protein [Candidatus Acidoferrum sp.]|nr:ice-binding family protein [Candidatus Acidoferrum sp.]
MRKAVGLMFVAVLLAGCGGSGKKGGGGGSGSPVALGSACTFGVLAGSTVTNVQGTATTISGDVGVSPGNAVTGFPSGAITGTIHAGDAVAATAQGDLTKAYLDLAGRTAPAPVTVAGDLGGQTLTAGLYKSTSSLGVTGDVTLTGDANAVWVFQIASALTTASGSRVVLTGGAIAKNVSWQVGSSASVGTGGVFEGNILALDSITLKTGAKLNGRALARNAAVTLDNGTITVPPCP